MNDRLSVFLVFNVPKRLFSNWIYSSNWFHSASFTSFPFFVQFGLATQNRCRLVCALEKLINCQLDEQLKLNAVFLLPVIWVNLIEIHEFNEIWIGHDRGPEMDLQQIIRDLAMAFQPRFVNWPANYCTLSGLICNLLTWPVGTVENAICCHSMLMPYITPVCPLWVNFPPATVTWSGAQYCLFEPRASIHSCPIRP